MKNEKRPYLKAILLTFLILLFPIISGTIIAISGLEGTSATMIQTAAFVVAFCIGALIAKKRAGSLQNIGLRLANIGDLKDYLWFLPLILIEILPFFAGFEEDLSFSYIAAYLLFMLAVGFTEELYFRGIIVDILKRKGIVTVIFLSSVLFSIGHLANLLAGAPLNETILQVIFAFLFGVVAVQITLATNSFLIPAIWHTLHNFIASITASNDGSESMIISGLQGVILLVYGIYLWKKKPDQLQILAVNPDLEPDLYRGDGIV